MIDWLRWLGILPVKLFFSFNGEGAFICPMVFVLPMEETEWNFLSSTAAVSSAFVVSFFAMVMIIAVGSFFMSVPLAFAPVMVSVLSGFFFGHAVSLFFSASARQRATILNGTSRCFATSSARSSPRAFSSSHSRICNIIALSRIAS